MPIIVKFELLHHHCEIDLRENIKAKRRMSFPNRGASYNSGSSGSGPRETTSSASLEYMYHEPQDHPVPPPPPQPPPQRMPSWRHPQPASSSQQSTSSLPFAQYHSPLRPPHLLVQRPSLQSQPPPHQSLPPWMNPDYGNVEYEPPLSMEPRVISLSESRNASRYNSNVDRVSSSTATAPPNVEMQETARKPPVTERVHRQRSRRLSDSSSVGHRDEVYSITATAGSDRDEELEQLEPTTRNNKETQTETLSPRLSSSLGAVGAAREGVQSPADRLRELQEASLRRYTRLPHALALQGNYEHTMRQFLEEAPEFLGVQDSVQDTPIHTALQRSHTSVARTMVEILIEKKMIPILFLRNSGGHSLLYTAVHCEDEDGQKILHLLLTHGANLTVADTDQRTAMHLCATNGHVVSLRIILRMATQTRNKLTRELLDLPDKYGRSALHLAADAGHMECTRLLVKAGADVNKNIEVEGGETALTEAVKRGDLPCIEQLLRECRASANYRRRSDHATPLHVLLLTRPLSDDLPHLVKILLHHGALALARILEQVPEEEFEEEVVEEEDDPVDTVMLPGRNVIELAQTLEIGHRAQVLEILRKSITETWKLFHVTTHHQHRHREISPDDRDPQDILLDSLHTNDRLALTRMLGHHWTEVARRMGVPQGEISLASRTPDPFMTLFAMLTNSRRVRRDMIMVLEQLHFKDAVLLLL